MHRHATLPISNAWSRAGLRGSWFACNRLVNQNEITARNATASIDVFSASSWAFVHLYAEKRSLPKYERAAMRWLERYLAENSAEAPALCGDHFGAGQTRARCSLSPLAGPIDDQRCPFDAARPSASRVARLM